jgi:hypothetical protein
MEKKAHQRVHFKSEVYISVLFTFQENRTSYVLTSQGKLPSLICRERTFEETLELIYKESNINVDIHKPLCLGVIAVANQSLNNNKQIFNFLFNCKLSASDGLNITDFNSLTQSGEKDLV